MGENDAKGGNKAFSGRHEFIGISDLLPIYDEFEDGAELLWQELESSGDDADGVPLAVFTEADLEAEYEIQDAQGDAPKP